MPDTAFDAAHRRPIFDVADHNSPAQATRVACYNAVGMLSDHKVIEAVLRALRETGHPALRSVDIEISGGVVILWGRVSSYYQKQLAQEVVQRIDGVQGIANGLEVICCR